MFRGPHPYRIDEKGRTKLPPKFVAQLGTEFMATRGVGDCLWLFRTEDWADFEKRITRGSVVNTQALQVRRYFIGNSVECTLDPQGRLTLPPVLRADAGITPEEGEIMIVGVGDWIEIWSRKKWDAQQDAMTQAAVDEYGRLIGM